MTNKERFKANVKLVEFEPHSYCNRKCWFCPNSFLDRQGPVKFLDPDIYMQVLLDLAGINYSEAVSYIGWCEPMSQPGLPDMIRAAKNLLPNARLFTNTNTDYISTEKVQELIDAGLGVLRCQLYFGKDEEFTKDAVRTKLDSLKLKLPGIEFKEKVPGKWFALVDDLIILAYAKDFRKEGYNRCDLKIRDGQHLPQRFYTCFDPIQHFGINYNGMAVPCCNIRSDYPPHEDVLLGQMNDSPGRIFELYQGVLIPEAQYPCNTCMGKQWLANHKFLFEMIYEDLKKERNGK